MFAVVIALVAVVVAVFNSTVLEIAV